VRLQRGPADRQGGARDRHRQALIERGIHPPTVYFPMIVKESIMIEPTETESKEQMDEFIAAMLEIADEAEKNPESFHAMPRQSPVCRVDETKAAKDMRFQGVRGNGQRGCVTGTI